MTQSTFEITDQGTDREALEFNGLRYWLDITSDPQNSIGWMVEDQQGVQDQCSVTEAAVVPGARDYVIERTRDGLDRAHATAKERGWSMAPTRSLQQELDEATYRPTSPKA